MLPLLKILPGVKELLIKLKQCDIHSIIVSTDITSRAHKAINTLKLDKYFTKIIGGDLVENSKPSPDLAKLALSYVDCDANQVAVIGDHPFDIMMGTSINAGLNIGIKDSKRTAYRWHQEKPYYKNISTIHFQFPILNAFSKKNGTMSVLSGSHKLGFIKKTITSQQHKKSVYSYIPKDIRKIEKKFVEKSIIMKLKDIVVFDENVLHRSNKNLTNKIRFAGTVRCQIIN